MKSSVITGVTGQDGAYLAQQLLERGDTVLRCLSQGKLGQFLAAEELGILDHPISSWWNSILSIPAHAFGCSIKPSRIVSTIWRRKVSSASHSNNPLRRRK